MAEKRTAVRHSAVYVGTVQHRRFGRVAHRFRARLAMAYLDLEELDAAFAGRWFFSHRRPAPVRFKREDYLGPADVPLEVAVRDAVQRELGFRPTGPIRLLTALRYFGYSFNPVSFYYCFDEDERVVAVLAEITNTPWRERHCYALAPDDRGRLWRSFAKRFHVSPFLPMDQQYQWRFSPPGARLGVHMANHGEDGKSFDATMALQRRAWRTSTLAWSWLRHPWLSLGILVGIYWHALRLWLKRAPFFAHPARRTSA